MPVFEGNFLPYLVICIIITFSVRLVPFVVFKDGKAVPDIVLYIGKYLPPAIITGIVIYCLRVIDLTAFPYGAREVLAAVLVVGLHLWKRNTLLSVFAGTLFYMVAIQRF